MMMTSMTRTALQCCSKRVLRQGCRRFYASEQVLWLPQPHATDPTVTSQHAGGILGAVSFVGLLVGANCLAIWCEVHNPNQSYFQDVASLRRTQQHNDENVDGTAALVEFDETVADDEVACRSTHPKYEKRHAAKVIHLQLKGW